MDARSTRVAERLNAPMMVAAALTIPMVAISESHPGGGLEDIARVLNWVTWARLRDRAGGDAGRWFRTAGPGCATTPSTSSSSSSRPRSCRRACRDCGPCGCSACLRLLRLAQLSREVFSLEGLHYAMLLAVLTVVGGGALFVAFEKHSQHLDRLGRDLLVGDDDDDARLEHLPDDDRRRDRLGRRS